MKTADNTLSQIKQALLAVVTRLRRLIGVLAQSIVQRDQLFELKEETRRLGAASVESATYASDELRALEQRLAKIEAELAELRNLLQGQQRPGSSSPSERPDEVVAGPPTG
jgi:hypothetical protein